MTDYDNKINEIKQKLKNKGIENKIITDENVIGILSELEEAGIIKSQEYDLKSPFGYSNINSTA